MLHSVVCNLCYSSTMMRSVLEAGLRWQNCRCIRRGEKFCSPLVPRINTTILQSLTTSSLETNSSILLLSKNIICSLNILINVRASAHENVFFLFRQNMLSRDFNYEIPLYHLLLDHFFTLTLSQLHNIGRLNHTIALTNNNTIHKVN